MVLDFILSGREKKERYIVMRSQETVFSEKKKVLQDIKVDPNALPFVCGFNLAVYEEKVFKWSKGFISNVLKAQLLT